MKNAWKLFEYKGSPIYLKYWFLAILLFVPPTWVISIFIGILVHELSHVKKAFELGYKTDYAFIDLFHGGAIIDNKYMYNNKHAISIAFSGPFSNLLMSLVSFSILYLLTIFGIYNISTMTYDNLDIFSKFLVEFTAINILLFIFNILPIYPLDGGRISKGVLRLIFGNQTGTIINGVMSLLLSSLILVYSILNIDIVFIILSVIFILSSVGQIKNSDDVESIN